MNEPHVTTAKPSSSDTHALSDWVHVRTEHQVPRSQGFAPEAIRHRSLSFDTTDGSRTPQMAKPPHWTETPGMPCVPLDKLGRLWEHHWAAPKNVPEALADEMAERMCRGCPVQQDCLDAALAEEGTLHHSSRFMVRGGLTPKGRWRESKQRAEPADA